MNFDTSKEFKIPIISGGRKTCVVRFPTDEEWCRYQRKVRAVTSLLGRNQQQTRLSGLGPAALELLGQIRKDQSSEEVFDEAEAIKFIERLRENWVRSECEGNCYRITLELPGAISVEHVLRIPTQAQVRDYLQASLNSKSDGRNIIRQTFLEPAAKLYDAVQQSVKGYEGPVPIIHKEVAITELLDAVERSADDTDPEG